MHSTRYLLPVGYTPIEPSLTPDKTWVEPVPELPHLQNQTAGNQLQPNSAFSPYDPFSLCSCYTERVP